MNSMISLFIDNELSLDDKSEFVDLIHEDRSYYFETKELLEQERLIRSDIFKFEPVEKTSMPFQWGRVVSFLWRPMGFAFAAALCAVIVMNIYTRQIPEQKANRFVIFRPDVHMVEITGSFTGWERVPMQKIGNSGYWELILNLPEGEHRFTYVLDGEKHYADPTVLAVENDDFGGINSIIKVESST